MRHVARRTVPARPAFRRSFCLTRSVASSPSEYFEGGRREFLLGHTDARTTRLYDRRQKLVTRNIEEWISV